MAEEKILLHQVIAADNQRVPVQLRQDPDARPFPQTARSVQGRFLGSSRLPSQSSNANVKFPAVPGISMNTMLSLPIASSVENRRPDTTTYYSTKGKP